MNMKISKQIGWGAILSYMNMAVSAIITLSYTPFMLRMLGQSEYGLYNTVASTVASLSVLSLGFGSSYVRFFSEYKARNDTESINSLNGMFLLVFSILGTIVFICGTLMIIRIEAIFAEGIIGEELKRARILMTLLVIHLAVSFPASVFTSIITANEEFIFQKTVSMIQQILVPIVCIPLLLNGKGSIGMVIGTTFIGYSIYLLNAAFVIFKIKSHFSFSGFDRRLLFSIATYSGFIALNLIVDQINLNIDKILLGRYRGTMSVAIYSVGFTLYHFYQMFSTSISNVFIPRVHLIWSNGSISTKEKNRRLSEMFAAIGRIQLMVLLLIVSGIAFFGRPFIKIWAGEGYENAYYVVLILAISSIVPLTQNVGIEIQRAKNRHQFRSVLYSLMAVINLVLSIYLCQIYGEVGSAIGTAISFVVANTILMNIYYGKRLKINLRLYWKYFVNTIISVIPAFCIGVLFCRKNNLSNLSILLSSIVLYSIIYFICIYIFACTKNEKNIIRKWLNI